MRYYLITNREYHQLLIHKTFDCPVCTIICNNLTHSLTGNKEIPAFILNEHHYKPHVEAELKREFI